MLCLVFGRKIDSSFKAIKHSKAFITRLSVSDFQNILITHKNKNTFTLVDVREKWEINIANISAVCPAINLPLSEKRVWDHKIDELLDKELKVICLCHHGVRSMQMCHYLKQAGFEDVCNVEGGIEQYAREIDSSIPKY